MSNSPFFFSSLIILTLNYNSLRNKINVLRSFISGHPHIDVIFLQEIRNRISNLNITGYRPHCTPRPGDIRYGGSAIYIKIHISYYTTNNTTFSDFDYSRIIL